MKNRAGFRRCGRGGGGGCILLLLGACWRRGRWGRCGWRGGLVVVVGGRGYVGGKGLTGEGGGGALLLVFGGSIVGWWLWRAFVRSLCREVEISRWGNFGVAATSFVFLRCKTARMGESVRFIPSLAVQVQAQMSPITSNVIKSRHKAQGTRYTVTSLIREPHHRSH